MCSLANGPRKFSAIYSLIAMNVNDLRNIGSLIAMYVHDLRNKEAVTVTSEKLGTGYNYFQRFFFFLARGGWK